MRLDWKGGLAFEAAAESGATLRFDASPEHGGRNEGPTPGDALLAAAGACAAMDVLSILVKKGQRVTSYRVEVEGNRREAGDWPRPVEAVRIRHILRGVELDDHAVARAVELTDEKYCVVVATLRPTAHVTMTYTIES